MEKFTLDEIYGVSINDYLLAHGKTEDDLIASIVVDIDLLKVSKMELAIRNETLTQRELELYQHIDTLYQKKLAHLKRIQEYVNSSIEDLSEPQIDER